MIVVLDLILWGIMAIAYEVTDPKRKWQRRAFIFIGFCAASAAIIDAMNITDDVFFPIVKTWYL